MTQQSKDPFASIPVQAMRAAVLESGELESFNGPHFLVDGEWRDYFFPSDETPHPEASRVALKRRGQAEQTRVISWREYFERETEDEDEWREKWLAEPMTMFGAAAERHGLRTVFADIIERCFTAPRGEPAKPAEPEREWSVEVAAARTAVALNALYDEAREARALATIPGLQEAFAKRLADLSKPKTPTPSPAAVHVAPRPQKRRKR